MARAQVPFFALNAGEVSQAALNRVDLEKMRLAAEDMINWTPSVLGPMSLRPGLKYQGSTASNAKCRLLPFIFSASTTSLLEVTAAGLRVRNASGLVTYPNNSTAILNGTMDGVNATYTRSTTTVTISSTSHGLTTGTSVYCDFTSGGALSGTYTITVVNANSFTVTTVASGTISTSNVTYYAGWSDTSTTGASVSFASGQLRLNNTEYAYARARQAVTVAVGDQSVLHCIKVTVARGPITFRIGSSGGAADVISNQTLDEGQHFIAFTPGTGTIYVEVEAISTGRSVKLIDGVEIFRNADLLITTPWAEADLNKIRIAQSGSIVFVACSGYQQYKIERRGANSWGVAKYIPTAGPYLGYSTRKEKIQPSGLTGNITLTSNQPFFTTGMVGSLFQISHPKQTVTINITGADQYSDYIRVTGVGTTDRAWSLSISYGSGASGTVTLERAFGTPDGWTTTNTYSANTTATIDDSAAAFGSSSNNLITYWRISAMPGATISGIITATLTYEGGRKIGAVRITGFTSSTSVSAEVVTALGDTTYTEDWRQGAWSSSSSWPSAVTFYDGRLWWAGLDKVYGSVSDDFYNFDPETEGDSGPIVRSVATGPVEGIAWMMPLQRLIVGTASSEVSIRSSSFDEPLTPSAFTARNASTMGSAPIQAVPIDSSGVFVQRNRTKIFEFIYDVETNDYGARELTRLNQTICQPGVVEIAVQRQPDTRIWFIKDDGTAAMLLYDRADSVVGWARFVTDGTIENVAILPTGEDDDVYFVVKRVIGGVDKRYIEKLASTSELDVTGVSFYVDSSIRFQSGTPTQTVTGLTHLIGKEVVVFAPRLFCFDGGAFEADNFQANSTTGAEPRTTYTVDGSGQITLDFAVTDVVIGLPYTAKFKSVKLAYGSSAGTALTQKKRVDHLGIVGLNTAPDGLRIGRDYDNMTKLSGIYKGKPLDNYFIVDEWDYDATAFNGKFDTDSRVCITAQSPYPATICGFVINMATNDRG